MLARSRTPSKQSLCLVVWGLSSAMVFSVRVAPVSFHWVLFVCAYSGVGAGVGGMFAFIRNLTRHDKDKTDVDHGPVIKGVKNRQCGLYNYNIESAPVHLLDTFRSGNYLTSSVPGFRGLLRGTVNTFARCIVCLLFLLHLSCSP